MLVCHMVMFAKRLTWLGLTTSLFILNRMGISGRLWRLLYRLYFGIHQGSFLSWMKYTVFINDRLDEVEEG